MKTMSVTGATGAGSANDAVTINMEIIVHINERLDEVARNCLRHAVVADDGMIAAEFCPLREHLLLVQYDRTKLNSRDVLSKVVAQRCTAQIIGPI